MLGDSMSESDVVDVDDKTWEPVVEKSRKPVVVMFSSPTCPHCRTIEPYFSDYATEFKDKVVFAKLNVVKNQYTPSRYGVMGTPTFKFFCKGKPVKELVGAVYPPLVKKTVEDTLEHGDECVTKSTEIDYSISGYT